jgi:cytochrome b6-f complex iron-sulfur subunit
MADAVAANSPAAPTPKPVVVPKPAVTAVPKPVASPAKPAAAAGHKEDDKAAAGPSVAEMAMLQAPVTRREFLNYAFLGSLGIFLVALGGATFFFALPRFGAGEFGGTFNLGAAGDNVPAVDQAPASRVSARSWISQSEEGVVALYNVCVHLGCLYGWQPVTNRFECPCHGSKYQKNGTYIEGPAPRSLDRFHIQFIDATGKVLAETNAKGEPVPIPDANAQLVVNTGKIILGKTHG